MMRFLERLLKPEEEAELEVAASVQIDAEEEKRLSNELAQRVYEDEVAQSIEDRFLKKEPVEPKPGDSFGVWSGVASTAKTRKP